MKIKTRIYCVGLIILISTLLLGCTTRPAVTLPVKTSTQTRTPKPSATKTVTSSPTPEPTLTVAPTDTPKPTETATATIVVEPTYPPYSQKQVLFEYGTLGYHAVYENDMNPYFPSIILYEDGQVIVAKPNSRLMEKQLSEAEICLLLGQLAELGIYEIETNGEHNPTDPLYDFGEDGKDYEKTFGGTSTIISLSGQQPQRIYVRDPFKDFLIQPMKDILDFLNDFSVSGLTPYSPDRILLWVDVESVFTSEDQKIPVAWPEEFPSLDTTTAIVYIEGTEASEVYDLFKPSYDYGVFVESDLEYTVFIRPILPHDTSPFSGASEPVESSIPDKCQQ